MKKNETESFHIEKITELLRNSEDDGTFYDSLYDLYFFIGITRGLDDAKNGRGTPLDEFNKEREAFYENYSRRLC